MKKLLLVLLLLAIPHEAFAVSAACKAQARKPSQQFLTPFPPENPHQAFQKTTQNYLKVPFFKTAK